MGVLPLNILSFIPYYDILGHFFVYGVASFLSIKSMHDKSLTVGKIVFPFGPIIITIFTIAEELLQSFIPTRTFSLLDLSSGFLGIIFAIVIVKVVSRI